MIFKHIGVGISGVVRERLSLDASDTSYLSIRSNEIVYVSGVSESNLGGSTGGGGWVEAEETVTTASLANNAYDSLTAPLGNWYKIKKVQTSDPCRVRAYINNAMKTSDLSRTLGEDPSGEHGLVLELVTASGNLSWYLMPVPEGYNAEDPVTEDTPIVVTNLSGGTTTIDVTFTFLKGTFS